MSTILRKNMHMNLATIDLQEHQEMQAPKVFIH